MKNFNKGIVSHAVSVALASLAVSSVSVLAEESDGVTVNEKVEQIAVIGSRSMKERTVADSPVPVDILSADDLNAMGGVADMTDNLKVLVPSYTATPATGDGSAFVRPTSLRGTAPDQTLVLIDGKRRHRSALVQFFAPAAGNGSHGADVGMIPAIALKRVEVLRDGASSQYGSDAIAGVINFVTNDAASGGKLALQYGNHYEGEASMKLALNQGFGLGADGFANFSVEYVDNEALSRGVIRPDAQELLDAGVTGVGADTPFGDAPLTQTWGRPETDALRMFLNTGIELEGDKKLYGRFNYADASGRYRFFYRNPSHSTLATLSGLGYSGHLMDVGFTPYLDGDQTDYSAVIGLEGVFGDDIYYDFSVSTGTNELDYFLNNTINPGLGVTSDLQIPQMDFDVGGYEQNEVNLNADFSMPLGDSLNVAYGFEWREETYTVIAGEVNSYADADGTIGAGASGFKGITPQDSGEYSRDNYAVYVDVEQDVNDEWLVQYALRAEDFSDFGITVNWKLASSYQVTDSTTLRGALSTGFHAPTPGQSNVRTTITTFDGTTGLQVEEGLISATDPRAIAFGGKEIKEEESTNISFGFTSQLGDSTDLSLDFYQIDVDDRIYRTGDFALTADTSISFYTNSLDVEHSGVDLVFTTQLDFGEVTTDVSFAYAYNKIEVTGQNPVNGINPVSDSTVEDIENNYPRTRYTLSTNTAITEQWHLMLRASYYGKHFDERGVIGDDTNPSAEVDEIVYVDAELSYKMSDSLVLKLGFSNLFDSYINEIDAPYANRQSVGLQYPRRSAANYEGGSWYLGLNYNY